MNFKNTFILFFLMSLFFIYPVSAQPVVTNGGFETGDLTGWSFNVREGTDVISSPFPEIWGAYTCRVYNDNNRMWQNINCSGHDLLSLDYYESSAGWINTDNFEFRQKDFGTTVATVGLTGAYNTINRFEFDISGYEGEYSIGYCIISLGGGKVYYFDNISVDNYIIPPPLPLMEFTNEPVEVGTYAHLNCNLDDYWNTHANEHFYLSYDYYYKNISDYSIIDFNERELNTQNTINLLPTNYPYFNQTGGCEIKASILYTYNDPVYTEVELGGVGYYVSTVLVNSTYEPPEEPEEPEEPEIPDPEPEPEPDPEPPIPPIQPNGTATNQSINITWVDSYYNSVNNTFGGLCSPIYNFTNWSLSPIYSLNDSIGDFNYHMNESFTQTAQDSSILYSSINTIYGAIHPKIRNVITYYLIWVVLLIVLKKD